MPRFAIVAALAALAALVAGCATGDGRQLKPPTHPAPTTTMAPVFDPPLEFPDPDDVPIDPLPDFEMFGAWRDGAALAERHTCEGPDVSPALTWTGVPDGTIELAITVVDLDAEGFVHWLLTGIDPAEVQILEGQVPPGATVRGNSFGGTGWAGPCPPSGQTHTYRFGLHALDQQLEALDDDPRAAASLVEGLALESAYLSATFSR